MEFQLITTLDGSPTYRFLGSEAHEDMHNSHGAYTETLAVYGPVVALAFEESTKRNGAMGPHFLSMGLGLGYNEFLLATLGLSYAVQWECDSYEVSEPLRQDLLDFVFDRPLNEEKRSTYEQILGRFARDSRLITARAALIKPEVTEGLILYELREAYLEGRWRVREAFSPAAPIPPGGYQGFLWDAFSRKTSPELWDPQMLQMFLAKSKGESCYFSTYACFGALKQTLRNLDFEVQVRQSVAGKRESVFASHRPLMDSLTIMHLQEKFRDISSHTQ